MPRDRLAFAIRVGGQDDLVGVLDRLSDLGDALGALGVHFPDHGEIVVRIDRPVLGGQVADMAHAGDHVEIAAEIFVDGLCFGRRFDDDDIHSRRFPDSARRRMGREDGQIGRRLLNWRASMGWAAE